VTAYSNKALTATTTATATYDTTSNTAFKLIDKFSLFVVGQMSAEEEPTKSMTKWSTDTAATRKTAAVDVSSNVSSYAIVVDVTTKLLLAQSVYCLSTDATPVPKAQTNDTTTPLTGCVLGAIGNAFGFWINNGTTTTTTLNGFRVFHAVSKLGATGTPNVPAEFAIRKGTYAASLKSGATIASYATAPTSAGATILTWETTAKECDTAKWDPATACYGVDLPWASGAFTDYNSVGPVKGSVRAWHFLAEKNADVTKNFQIEKDNKINWIIEESVATR
jgi:hypothetical protein